MSKGTIYFNTNGSNFADELLAVARLFFVDYEIIETKDSTICDIVYHYSINNNSIYSTTSYKDVQFSTQLPINNAWSELEYKRYFKRYAKMSVYFCLKQYFDYGMPWGSLTGIRPTKLAYEIGKGFESVFRDKFDVTDSKIQLVAEILDQQRNLRITDDSQVDIYVGVPFCTSRCSYCSFTSGVLSKLRKHVEPYVDNLVFEIRETLQLVRNNGYIIRNVYFGGGTPTSLTAEQLDRVLGEFDFPINEFTVEAGRPDTITRDKLDVLAKNKVNRISINPQTFNQVTLDKVGRQHTIQEIFDTYNLARSYDFDINMDLIAGLPDESYSMFCHSLDTAVSLQPDNITVHTLALKRGSVLVEQGEEHHNEEQVKQMVDYAREKLMEVGYKPYYLYRQKYVSANLENVGYAKKGKQCLYNIDIMEETTNILACGCNAISKRVFTDESRIERQANPKDVITYNKDLAVYLARKKSLFQK